MKRSADVGRLMLEKTRENPASGIRYPISVLTMGPGSLKRGFPGSETPRSFVPSCAFFNLFTGV